MTVTSFSHTGIFGGKKNSFFVILRRDNNNDNKEFSVRERERERELIIQSFIRFNCWLITGGSGRRIESVDWGRLGGGGDGGKMTERVQFQGGGKVEKGRGDTGNGLVRQVGAVYCTQSSAG